MVMVVLCRDRDGGGGSVTFIASPVGWSCAAMAVVIGVLRMRIEVSTFADPSRQRGARQG